MKPRSLSGSIVVVALMLGAAAQAGRVRLALAPGDRAPHLAGTEARSGESRIVDWQTQRLWLVNFWATWCVPCQEEMPSLQKLYAERSADGFQILGVNAQDIADVEMMAFLHLVGVQYPILKTDDRMSKSWGGISALPASFLINDKGIILRRYVGATPEQVAGLLADVHAVLDGQPLQPAVVPTTPRIATADPAEGQR